MSIYNLELTEGERNCGVTLDQVADVLPKVLVRDGSVMLPVGTSPALAGAVARCAFAGPAVFSHLSHGYPIYRKCK